MEFPLYKMCYIKKKMNKLTEKQDSIGVSGNVTKIDKKDIKKDVDIMFNGLVLPVQ